MDHAFFSTNQEQVLFEGVEIEAHTAGKAIDNYLAKIYFLIKQTPTMLIWCSQISLLVPLLPN